MTDFRELCAELVTELEKWCGTYSSTEDSQSVINRARAALAEPEPEGPTLDDIYELCEEHEFILADGFSEEESIHALWEIARAVLARWGNNNTSRSS